MCNGSRWVPESPHIIWLKELCQFQHSFILFIVSLIIARISFTDLVSVETLKDVLPIVNFHDETPKSGLKPS